MTLALQATGLDWHIVWCKWLGLKRCCAAMPRAVGSCNITEAATDADSTADGQVKVKLEQADRLES